MIKEIRAQTALGLKEAKDLAESGGLIRAGLTMSDGTEAMQAFALLDAKVELVVSQSQPDLPAPPPPMPPVDGLAPPQPGNAHLRLTAIGPRKIDVIKEVRALTGMGLKEAKDVVEGLGLIFVNTAFATVTAAHVKLTILGATTEILTEGSSEDASLPSIENTASGPIPSPTAPPGSVPSTFPTDLPKADLRKLGLNPDALVPAPLRNERRLIALGQGGIHG